MGRKVLVVGLDGGTWQILDRFMALGVMPNLQRMCKEGYRARLRSSIAMITPVAWTSFATGGRTRASTGYLPGWIKSKPQGAIPPGRRAGTRYASLHSGAACPTQGCGQPCYAFR